MYVCSLSLGPPESLRGHFKDRLRPLPRFPTSHSHLSVTPRVESQVRDGEGQDAGVGSRVG